MECQFNMGKAERRIRMVLGVVILGIGGTTLVSEWGSLLAFVLGVFVLFSGIRQFCPIRKWLGINTYDPHHAENH